VCHSLRFTWPIRHPRPRYPPSGVESPGRARPQRGHDEPKMTGPWAHPSRHDAARHGGEQRASPARVGHRRTARHCPPLFAAADSDLTWPVVAESSVVCPSTLGWTWPQDAMLLANAEGGLSAANPWHQQVAVSHEKSGYRAFASSIKATALREVSRATDARGGFNSRYPQRDSNPRSPH
jgi:hypothetical protein